MLDIGQGGKAQILADDRDSSVSAVDEAAKDGDQHQELVQWVLTKLSSWRVHRDANYTKRWDEYERLWRAIYSGEEKMRSSERSRLIVPALSEAVENTAAELEEAIFGRGDFFDAKGEFADQEEMKMATEKNKINLREDLARTEYIPNVAECIISGAVYGTGIGEILVETKIHREVAAALQPDGSQVMAVSESKAACAVLRSINPRNFLIDPNAKTIDTALGAAVEEYVGTHIIYDGIRKGDFHKVVVAEDGGDIDLTADPQTITENTSGKAHVYRYYGLVPRSMLAAAPQDDSLMVDSAEEKLEDVLEGELPGGVDADEAEEQDDSDESSMVEAIVVIVNKARCLKAIANPYLMRDRPLVAFPWDIVPGRFWGRGVCEKGVTPQKALDAELRSRMDALAFAAAPMMAMDASKLPRGFKMEVYPGKSILVNGDPGMVMKPFKFGELDQHSWQQAAALDQMVQRATGSLDAVAMAQSGAGGQARSGAMSMSLSGIVKRHKRTLMSFIDRFLVPSLQKIMWRNMQYYPARYLPLNFSFLISNTMGIMQREYETAQLVQLLQTMQAGTPEYRVTLMGIVANTGLTNRVQLVELLNEAMERDKQLAAQQAAMGDPNAQPVDPMQTQLQMLTMQLDMATKKNQIAKLQAETLKITAETQLTYAKVQTELVQPQIQTTEVAMKGVYNTPEEQMQSEFDRRLQIANLMETKADRESNERIARMQTQGAVAKAALEAAAAQTNAPQPAPVPSPVPVPMPVPVQSPF
jgi:hypothetical protein